MIFDLGLSPHTHTKAKSLVHIAGKTFSSSTRTVKTEYRGWPQAVQPERMHELGFSYEQLGRNGLKAI